MQRVTAVKSPPQYIPRAKDRSNDGVHATRVGVLLFGQAKVSYTHEHIHTHIS